MTTESVRVDEISLRFLLYLFSAIANEVGCNSRSPGCCEDSVGMYGRKKRHVYCVVLTNRQETI